LEQTFEEMVENAVKAVVQKYQSEYSQGAIGIEDLRSGLSVHFKGTVPQEALKAVLKRMPKKKV
jgi:hypothetical protein